MYSGYRLPWDLVLDKNQKKEAKLNERIKSLEEEASTSSQELEKAKSEFSGQQEHLKELDDSSKHTQEELKKRIAKYEQQSSSAVSELESLKKHLEEEKKHRSDIETNYTGAT